MMSGLELLAACGGRIFCKSADEVSRGARFAEAYPAASGGGGVKLLKISLDVQRK